MEIITLLKANIRRKKGSFTSVVLLTLIIAMSVTTILSIKESVLKGVNHAHGICGSPDVLAAYFSYLFTDDFLEKIERNDKVKRVDVTESILVEKTSMGNEENHNLMSLIKADENTRILKANLSGIAENAPRLRKGEIYVTQGLLTSMNGKSGEKIAFTTLAGEYEFTVKGILLDPMLGSSLIGWKNLCISDEDFSEITSAVLKAETEDKHCLGKTLEIYKSDDCTLTNGQFRRQLNLDTSATDMAIGSLTIDMSINYTTLFPEVISSFLMVFVMFLLAIVVIVTVHSISVEIETNYVTLGMLKALGFDKTQIRLLFLGQYLLAEMIGAAAGMALSVPLVKWTSNIFVTITAIPAVTSVPTGIIALILAALFLLSAVSIFFVTIKAGKISPVRAISGAKKEIYFDSRINVPISRRLLSGSLALRQFTSAKRRYVGTLVIVAVLVFFMMTITTLANTVNSKKALEAMGTIITEINVTPEKKLTDHDMEEIEKEIERFSRIGKAYYFSSSYFSFDGEEMLCQVYKDPSVLPVLKGRAPIYDNEIAVSPILLDEFNLKIGDEVTVGWNGKKETYLISGTGPFMNDLGRCLLLSRDAAEKLGYDYRFRCYYSLENGHDESLNKKIADSLNEKFGDMIQAEAATTGLMGDSEGVALTAMQMIIYVFSVLFSLIVVHMVCSKAFVQERTDIGIYRATGFQTSGLQVQFALRFLIVSMIGSAAGGILSYFFSEKILGILLRSIGITNFTASIRFSSFAIPIIVTCSSFLIFAYLVSGRIKKVKIRELVTE